MSHSLSPTLQILHCLCQLLPRAWMDTLAIEEAINRMLRDSRLTAEQFLRKSACSLYQRGICGTGVRGFARMILNRSDVIQDADVFTFLRTSFDFLSYWNEWLDCANGATQEQAARVRVTEFSVWRKRFAFRMQKMTPDNVGKSLWREGFSVVFGSQLYHVSAMNLRVFPR